MTVPEGILCSKTHEWALEEENGIISIGLTDWAVGELGDIVFVELPEAGQTFQKNETFATIESVKAASEIYMPISGTIKEINEQLINSPELINEDVWGSWLVKVEPENFKDDALNLMDYNDYRDEVQ